MAMATQIVMDHTGDTRHEFDPKKADELKAAEERFRELTGLGFTASERIGPGETQLLREFKPDAQETIFFPRLKGG
jgi:hypothetical protein